MSASGGTLRVVSLASLTWERGYPYALLALRRLLDRAPGAAEYRIYGAGIGLRELLFTIADLDLERAAAVCAPPPRPDASDVLASADVYLDLSVRAAPGGGLRAALACGVPAVVTAEAADADLVRDGVEGILVPARDPEAATAALARLRDPTRRAELAVACARAASVR